MFRITFCSCMVWEEGVKRMSCNAGLSEGDVTVPKEEFKNTDCFWDVLS